MKAAWVLVVLIGLGNPPVEQVDQVEFATFASEAACEDAKTWLLSVAAGNQAAATAAGYPYVSGASARCFPSYVKPEK